MCTRTYMICLQVDVCVSETALHRSILRCRCGLRAMLVTSTFGLYVVAVVWSRPRNQITRLDGCTPATRWPLQVDTHNDKETQDCLICKSSARSLNTREVPTASPKSMPISGAKNKPSGHGKVLLQEQQNDQQMWKHFPSTLPNFEGAKVQRFQRRKQNL